MSNYWGDRLADALNRLSAKSEREIQKQLSKYYAETAKQTIKDFEDTYSKILTTMENDKEPTPADLYKLDKYWQSQAQLRRELQKLGNKEIALLTEAFERNWFEIYYSIGLPSGAAFNTVDTHLVQQLLNQVWCADGLNWSARVWKNTEQLAETLNEQLIHCVATGKKTTELKNILQERFGVSYSRANTLVRTELAHIQTQAAKQRYEDAGLTYYEILGNEDNTCGGTAANCHQLHGKKFKYSEMTTGKNAPPFHPNCKCCIIPVVEID